MAKLFVVLAFIGLSPSSMGSELDPILDSNSGGQVPKSWARITDCNHGYIEPYLRSNCSQNRNLTNASDFFGLILAAIKSEPDAFSKLCIFLTISYTGKEKKNSGPAPSMFFFYVAQHVFLFVAREFFWHLAPGYEDSCFFVLPPSASADTGT